MHSMKRKARHTAALLLFALCMAAACALAIDADTVVINGATLTDGYYWKNDGTTSPAYIAGWNAHFSTGGAEPVLQCNGVSITTSNTSGAMIRANGDFVMELLGSNTLSYDYLTDSQRMKGIYLSVGNLKIVDKTPDGTGSLSIEIKNTSDLNPVMGIHTQEDFAGVTIESGAVTIAMLNNQFAHGIRTGSAMIRGGSTTITNTAADYAYGLYAANQFIMSAGSVSATVSGGNGGTAALVFINEASILGGYGVFTNTRSGYGAIWGSPSASDFRVTGGHLILSSSDKEALYFNVASDPQAYGPDVRGDILVSADSGGAGKTSWEASMGLLAGSQSDTSPFRYVEFVGKALLALMNPQTGDSANPLLSLGLGLLALSGAGTLLLLRRRRA